MTSEMERTAIVAPNAPGGRSYSQAVGVGDFVFVAGTAGKIWKRAPSLPGSPRRWNKRSRISAKCSLQQTVDSMTS
jgi:hypothetical protein